MGALCTTMSPPLETDSVKADTPSLIIDADGEIVDQEGNRNGGNMGGGSGARGIDEALYSRQLYVLGHDAMARMSEANVLISGLGGLGVEVAKDVILAGVKSVTLHDTVDVTHADLSSQFYVSELDIGKNRADACLDQLSALNSYVQTDAYSGTLTEDFLAMFKVVVLTESTEEEIRRISDITHSAGIPLVFGQTAGLCGRIFCDFGEHFVVMDADGEEPLRSIVATISQELEGVVTCIDGTKHGLADGDFVKFSEVKGMTQLNEAEHFEIKVLGPDSFSIGVDTTAYPPHVGGGIVTQVKKPKIIKFTRYSEAAIEPQLFLVDFAKMDQPSQLHLAFLALDLYRGQFGGTTPKPWNEADADALLTAAKDVAAKTRLGVDLDEDMIKLFAKTCAGNVIPVASVIGSIVAQEALKALTGKFSPIEQFLYFDGLECLKSRSAPAGSPTSSTSRYDGQRVVFGNDFQEQLSNFRVFIVGAGAIGCELLKSFAMMGIGSGPKGRIVITDMDMIEKSNLNRQFLFRPKDIHQPKSLAAANAVRTMNEQVKIEAHTLAVGEETEESFNDDFYESIDCIANALDNVKARAYMDGRAFVYKLPLLDSGTMGAKGSVQVVMPHVSEMYSASHDPPEKEFPMCTLKHFPHKIEHCVQWARDLFQGSFTNPAETAKSYLADPSGFKDNAVSKERGEGVATVVKFLGPEMPKTFADCLKWARLQWEALFRNEILQILHTFPPDDEDNAKPFWIPPKRCPRALEFDANDALHLDFLVAAANLKAEMHGIPRNRNRSQIADLVQTIEVPCFSPSDATIPVNDEEIEESTRSPEEVEDLVAALPDPAPLSKVVINPLSFEKDDDTNMHMDFITSASNLRATCYDIENADKFRSKQIAGRIIPAIATTTAMVAGLVSLELIKIVQGHKNVEVFKNAYVNLAMPFFGFSEPIAPAKTKFKEHDWDAWSMIDIPGDITVDQMITHFKDTYGIVLDFINFDTAIIYADFFAPDKVAQRKAMLVTEAILQVTKKPLPKTRNIILRVSGYDENDEDAAIELPCIRYKLPTS